MNLNLSGDQISGLNFCWIKKNLGASAFPKTTEEIDFIKSQEINMIINLSETSHNQVLFTGIQLIHCLIKDLDIPTKSQILQITEIIDKNIVDKKILIHCDAGCGRTGTIIGLYLCYTNPTENRDTIIANLRKLRPCSIETMQQENIVRYFNFKKPSQ